MIIAQHRGRHVLRPLILSFVLLLAAAAGPVLAADTPQAPFGDKVSAALVNYNRVTPTIGSAGKLNEGGVAEAKELGFALILDLRAVDEGIDAEKAEAETVGIRYINLPVSTKAPTEEQVAQFAAIVENPTNAPLLVHCVSANRVGAMWALYRASQGVPAEIAVEEGETLGLKTSRKAAVRERLGLPAE